MYSRSQWRHRASAIVEPTAHSPQGQAMGQAERRADGTAVSQPLERVALLWSGEGVAGPTDAFQSSGAHVAALAWMRALSRWGRINSLEMFVPLSRIDQSRRRFQEMPAAVPGSGAASAPFLPESDLPGRLRSHPYDVLHETGDDLTRSSYIRSRVSDRVLPITCSQYAISYSFLLYAVYLRLLTAQIYPCDAIVCSTLASRRAMENRLSDITERYSRAWDRPAPLLPRLDVIPWGVDTELFAPRDQATARRKLGLPLDRPILLCLGRVQIYDKMDWSPLLLALERVSRSMKQRPVLVLAGTVVDPEYSQHILAHAAQLGLSEDLRVLFNCPPACLPSLYTACDVFVSPTDSPTESFGLTIIEAMASGRPVVSSDWDGYKELVVHGETGFKVRTDWADCLGELDVLAPTLPWYQEHLHVGQSVSVDIAEMARALTRLLENQELREEMGRRGRARVEALYDWPAVISQWEALWAELTAIAGTVVAKHPDRLDHMQPNYFEQFSHYASRIIDDTIPVQLTARGKELLAGQMPLLLHPWAQGFLIPKQLHGCLSALQPADWMCSTVLVGDLIKILQKAKGLSRDRGLRHIMWLAKYDLISLGQEAK